MRSGVRGVLGVTAAVAALSHSHYWCSTSHAAAPKVMHRAAHGSWENEKETRELSVPHVAGSAVSVKSKNGSIRLVKGGGDSVRVVATLSAKTKERLSKIKVTAVREDGGELKIVADFPDAGWLSGGGDGCSFEVTLPDAQGLHVRTSNGSISAEGFSGKADYETSNASVTVTGHGGELVVDTSNGSVKASEIAGPVTIETSNAKVTLDHVATPARVDTSNGGVDVTLRDDATGPVTIDTSNSSVTLTVGAAFAGTLKADTSNGKVTVESAEGAKVNNAGKSAKIDFPGDGHGTSVIDTSNGSVKIRQAKK